MRDLVLMAFVSVGSSYALFRPDVGILVFTFLGFFNPHAATWGIARALPLSMIVAICTLLGGLLSGGIRKLPPGRELYLLLALWLVFCFSTIFAISPERAWSKLIYISKILLMVFFAMSFLDTDSKLQALLRVVALSIGFYGLKGGIWVFLTGGQHLVYGPEHSFLEANNSIGLALAMNLPLLYYLNKTENRQWLRWIIRAMMVFSYPAIICTYSRGAWLGLATATALLIIRSKHTFKIIVGGALIVVFMFSAITVLLPQKLLDRYDTLVNYEKDSSAVSRLWSWEFCARVARANPFTGAGFDYYSIQSYRTYFPEFLERWPRNYWSCHSTPLTVLGEHGYPGMIIWSLLIISYFLSTRKLQRDGKNAQVPSGETQNSS